MEDWKRVTWSDGTKINCLGSYGRKWVWKMKGEGLCDKLVQGTLKYGGGHVMLWGCFGWYGAGHTPKIDDTIDSNLYVRMVSRKASIIGTKCPGNG